MKTKRRIQRKKGGHKTPRILHSQSMSAIRKPPIIGKNIRSKSKTPQNNKPKKNNWMMPQRKSLSKEPELAQFNFDPKLLQKFDHQREQREKIKYNFDVVMIDEKKTSALTHANTIKNLEYNLNELTDYMNYKNALGEQRHRYFEFGESPPGSSPNNSPKGSQKGGAELEPMTMEKFNSEYSGHFTVVYMCALSFVENHKYKLTCSDITTGKQQSMTSAAAGTWNAVYDATIFDHCDNTKHILRVSNNAFLATDFERINNYIEECRIGIQVSEDDIGPKIYKFGLMINTVYNDRVHFYSIIERVNGKSVHKALVDKPCEKPGSITVFSKAADAAHARASKLYKQSIMDKCIDKLRLVATNYGYLLMDTKPENAMLIEFNREDGTKDFKVYLIDFDPQFCLQSDEPKMKETYKIINTVFFALHCLIHLSACDEVKQYGVNLFNDIITSMDSNPESMVKSKNIINVMQDLYLTHRMFQQICECYKYSQYIKQLRRLTFYADVAVGSLDKYFVPFGSEENGLSYFLVFYASNEPDQTPSFDTPLFLIKNRAATDDNCFKYFIISKNASISSSAAFNAKQGLKFWFFKNFTTDPYCIELMKKMKQIVEDKYNIDITKVIMW